jgi:hypothetical protein
VVERKAETLDLRSKSLYGDIKFRLHYINSVSDAAIDLFSVSFEFFCCTRNKVSAVLRYFDITNSCLFVTNTCRLCANEHTVVRARWDY